MFKELQITLYDIFGYLLPGAIILLAFAIFFWTLFWPAVPLVIHWNVPVAVAACLGFIAYLAGHLGQGIGNVLEKLPLVQRTLEADLPLSLELSELVRDAVACRFGVKATSLRPKELSLVCDQALVQAGSSGDREIFVYREGFYRGNCVALAFLGLTLLMRLIFSPSLVVLGQKTVAISRSELALAVVIAAIGSWLSFNRYLRFACHKNAACLARFLALATAQSNAHEGKKP